MNNEKRKFLFRKNWVFLLLLLFLIVNIITINKSRKLSKLESDKASLTKSYQNLNTKVKNFQTKLNFLEQKDQKYRKILGLDEFPIKNGGFGGVDMYGNIYFFDENVENFVKKTHMDFNNFKTDLIIQKSSFNQLSNYIDSLEYLPIRSPISNIDLNGITSIYGYRIHPLTNKKDFHDGVDLVADVGSPIYSPGKGIVKMLIFSEKGYGNKIVIDHLNGYRTLYAHLNKFNVKIGDTVNVHEIIGSVGNTGLSTGSHLHYEIHYNHNTIDPMSLIQIQS